MKIRQLFKKNQTVRISKGFFANKSGKILDMNIPETDNMPRYQILLDKGWKVWIDQNEISGE